MRLEAARDLSGYSTDPTTIGYHIRRSRRARGISADSLAKLLTVQRITIRAWERNANVPSIRYWPSITEFLGYAPPFPTSSSPERACLEDFRRARGFTKAALAAFLAVDRGTIARWETGISKPSQKLLQRLDPEVQELFAVDQP